MKPLTKKEISRLKKYNTPIKVQDLLNSLRYNFCKNGDTVKSPAKTLRTKTAHCFEGALLGAYLLSLQGHPPLIMHLMTTKDDLEHVIAPFKQNGFWGALSKTNHVMLGYRDPVYKNIRELVMSYFHEYFTDKGKKSLRKYSSPLNLNVFEKTWSYEEEDLWGIDEELDKKKHFHILPANSPVLRKADSLEIRVGKILQWKRIGN